MRVAGWTVIISVVWIGLSFLMMHYLGKFIDAGKGHPTGHEEDKE